MAVSEEIIQLMYKPSMEDLQFYCKEQTANEKLRKKLMEITYVIKKNPKYIKCSQDFYDIKHALLEEFPDRDFVSEGLMDIIYHCRIHNKYDARSWFKCVDSYRPVHDEIIAKKILQVTDDKCLSTLLDFIAIVDTSDFGIQNSPYEMCLIIDYFLKDYEDEDYRKCFEKISREWRHYQEDEVMNEVGKEFRNMTAVLIYRMFLEHDDALVYTYNQNCNVEQQDMMRLKNNQAIYSEYHSYEEFHKVRYLTKKKYIDSFK